MTSVGRFTVRWRLAGVTTSADELLEELLGGALDEAFEAAAIEGDAEIAIAVVDVPPQRVRLGSFAAARVWAESIAAAVAARINEGGSAVVRYPNRVAALADLVTSLTCGDRRRVWAWRQLGLLREGVPDAESVYGGLTEIAAHVPAVVARLAQLDVLVNLVALLGPVRLSRLAELAWVALGERGFAAITLDIRERTRGIAPEASPWRPCRSPIARSVAETTDPVVAVALAALAVADAEPAAVVQGRAGELVAQLVVDARQCPDPGRETAVRAPEATGTALGPVAEPAPCLDPVDGETTRHSEPAVVVMRPLHLAADVDRPSGVAGHGATTAHAGVLFLLHLLEACQSDPPGTRWDFYRLADELVRRSTIRRESPRADDPALLAFCGLPPDSEPPHDERAEPRIHACADAVITALRAALRGREPADLDDTSLLATIVRRRGAVRADPGWIEVELGLDEVSVDLRAAGLDLDPGWLPELGCVVRFRYV
jgi:hypothetical protein